MDLESVKVGYRYRTLNNIISRQYDIMNVDETCEKLKMIETYGLETLEGLRKHCDAVIRRRVKIASMLEEYIRLNRIVYFVTLTFDDEILGKRRKDLVKRKARRFLHEICDYYFFIEEYGEENNRYHLHAIVVLKNDDWTKVREWDYRQNVKEIHLTKKSVKKVTRYMCKYLTKQQTKIYRCKATTHLINIQKKVKWYARWTNKPENDESVKEYRKQIENVCN